MVARHGACAGLVMLFQIQRRACADRPAGLPRDNAEWPPLARPPQPWVAGALALLLFITPVVIWNVRHGWASIAFQGNRADGLRFQPLAPLAVWGGEALFVLPWIWVPLILLWLRALRRGPTEREGGCSH